jgi:hypothetical protein
VPRLLAAPLSDLPARIAPLPGPAPSTPAGALGPPPRFKGRWKAPAKEYKPYLHRIDRAQSWYSVRAKSAKSFLRPYTASAKPKAKAKGKGKGGAVDLE